MAFSTKGRAGVGAQTLRRRNYAVADKSWDIIIVGQGIAGTTLAWQMQQAGQRVLIIDACEPVTSSKIAAGLMTPITGKRLVVSLRCDEFLPLATTFYRDIEEQTGRTFFHDRTALRLFSSDLERELWVERSQDPTYQSFLSDQQPTPLLDPDIGDASGGGFAMNAAQLDVAGYLEASRAVLTWESMTLDWDRDISFDKDGVSVRGYRTRRLVSCEGYAATRNPYFSWVPFKAAKGDILTVRFHRPVPANSLHRGVWVAPTSQSDVFRVGSTYEWEKLDQEPDAAARAKIERRLKEFVRVPYTVLDHQAAVRPIINESKALVGVHPEHSELGYFNGLGSKGSLHAPWYAQRFSDYLLHKTRLPAYCDVQQHF